MRLTIDEYSNRFKMSKEMIASKIKAKKLDYIIDNDTTFIIVDNDPSSSQQQAETQKEPPKPSAKTIAKPKMTVATVIALYQRENQQLKEKIVKLEEKIDRLIDDKEQMLRDEMSKIEKLYNTKDEQLKNILELVNAKLMLESKAQTIHEVESYPSGHHQVDDKKSRGNELVELRSYLKTLDLKSYQRKIIKKRFLAVYDSDVRIIQQNGKLYLDFSKYDYSDLLEY